MFVVLLITFAHRDWLSWSTNFKTFPPYNLNWLSSFEKIGPGLVPTCLLTWVPSQRWGEMELKYFVNHYKVIQQGGDAGCKRGKGFELFRVVITLIGPRWILPTKVELPLLLKSPTPYKNKRLDVLQSWSKFNLTNLTSMDGVI